MLMNQTAEYVLRAMSVVANSPDGPVRAGAIAEEAELPGPYLSKLLRRLVVAELLVAKRGRGGGFVLARPAHTISFAEVLGAVDAMPPLDHCAFGWARCNYEKPCPLHETYEIARRQFIDWAKQTHLDQVPRATSKKDLIPAL